MQSRLQFACATAIKPDILVVDEILGAGDAYFSMKSSARMEKLTKSGCTLLLVSHSMGQVLQFCQRVIWVSNGLIKRDGEPRDVIGEYEVFMQQKANRLELSISGGGTTSKEQLSLKLARVHGTDRAAQISVSGEPPDEEHAPDTDSSSAISEISLDSDSVKIRLKDGQLGYRWPSEKGVKLTKLGIYQEGTLVNRIKENSVVEFRGELVCETSGPISCWYFIRINGINGKYVTMICSPKTSFQAEKGETRTFVAKLDPCLLGEGEYYIAFNIIPGEDSIKMPTRRYDLVTNFCDFSIYRTLNYIEDSIYKQPANWVF